MLDEEKKEQKSMLIAMALVVVVLMVFNRMTAKPVTSQGEVPLTKAESVVSEEAVIPEIKASTTKVLKTATIDNAYISGEIQQDENGQLTLNSLDLKKYHETSAKDSPVISLLNNDYQVSLDWNGLGYFSENTAQLEKLTPETPVEINLENDFVILNRKISLDNAYMITFTDTITNKTDKAIQPTLEGNITRSADSIPTNRSTVHEGFLGLFDNKEKEERYTEIKEDKPFEISNQGGWIGQTDKYWQTIFIPDQSVSSDMKFEKTESSYISSFKNKQALGAGETLVQTTKLFAGAKELPIINDYTDQGIPRFDLSIDFGWYYFLTKPFLYFLGWLYALVGNMGIAILIFATLIRIALLPIATKSYESMAKMKKVQPKIKVLQERFKDNRQQLQIEMMNLYKRDKVNPASGCLPMLIQIPVFFALYKVLSVSILMRQAPFFGWITDLSQPDPASIFTIFGLIPWPIPSFLNIGVWPVLMGLTMVIQQRLNPQATTNKDQQVMMTLMPIVFTFMMGNFASGLVIYWTWSNILSIAQQRYIMKKVGV